MTVTDQLKIIDNKTKANQAQYDLDRLAAKISAYSSGDLGKYEYLTGKYLWYKPSVIEQAKFDILRWACHLVKLLKKIRLKVLLGARVILIMIAIMLFSNFTKGIWRDVTRF